MTCVKLDSCEKIKILQDKDMLDSQFVESVNSVCSKCNEQSIVECIMSGTGELCTGSDCPLFKKCFPLKYF